MSWDGIKDYGFGSKNRTPEQDAEYRSRQKGIPKKRKWTKDRCIDELDDILSLLKKILREDEKLNVSDPHKLKSEHIRDLMIMMDKILDFMRYLYPPVQQNLNVNVDMTADKVIERLKNWKRENVIEVEEE